MKVSVIMPAYNASKFISHSVESVINQTYTNWELIIINDASSDETKDICEKYANEESRIKLINLESNCGIARARNKGIVLSTGRFIAFLDSDDLWKENKLSNQVAFMLEEEVAFSYTGYEVIDEEGELMNKKFKVPKSLSYKELLKVNKVGCLTVLIDRRKIKSFEMPVIKHEDYATWLMILKENNIVAKGLQQNLASYRKSSNSVTSNKLESVKWTWNIYRVFLGINLLKSTLYFIRYIYLVIKKNR